MQSPRDMLRCPRCGREYPLVRWAIRGYADRAEPNDYLPELIKVYAHRGCGKLVYVPASQAERIRTQQDL